MPGVHLVERQNDSARDVSVSCLATYLPFVAEIIPWMQAPRQPRQTTSLRTHPPSGPVIWRRPDFPSIGSIGRNTARLPASRSSSCMAGRVQAATARPPAFSIRSDTASCFSTSSGCGKSTPSANDDDAIPALTDNTSRHLIDDVSALLQELNINGKMHVFGAAPAA